MKQSLLSLLVLILIAFTANVSAQVDTDLDGVNDDMDQDDDNDGVLDADEQPPIVYTVYFYARTRSNYANMIDITVEGATTQSAIISQAAPFSDYSFMGRNFGEVLTGVVANAAGLITVRVLPDEQSGGDFVIVDGMLLVGDDGSEVFIENNDAGYSDSGDWGTSGNSTGGNPFNGDSRFLRSGDYDGGDEATFGFSALPMTGGNTNPDGDTADNSLDSDSDNDGCPDVLEYNPSLTLADIDTIQNGGVDYIVVRGPVDPATGVPTATAGYTPTQADLTRAFDDTMDALACRCGISGPMTVAGACTGTASDLEFTINVAPDPNGLTGATYNVTGAVTMMGLAYDTDVVLTVPGGSNGVEDIITVTDVANVDCTFDITVSDPGSCDDKDGDGVFDDVDLDVDNDGIPNELEFGGVSEPAVRYGIGNAQYPAGALSATIVGENGITYFLEFGGATETFNNNSPGLTNRYSQSGGVSEGVNSLQLAVDSPPITAGNVSEGNAVTLKVTASEPLFGATFSVYDIDNANCGGNNAREDDFRIWGFVNGVKVAPTITPVSDNPSFLVDPNLNGQNEARLYTPCGVIGTQASDPLGEGTAESRRRGTADVIFPGAIDSFFVEYREGSMVIGNDPPNRFATLGDIYNTPPADDDGDGVPNFCDLDADGDGCPDAVEAGIPGVTNFNGTVGMDSMLVAPFNANGISTLADSDGDGEIDYVLSNNYLDANINACEDKDMDGIPDVTDLDNDNDGIPNAIECPSAPYDVYFYSRTSNEFADQLDFEIVGSTTTTGIIDQTGLFSDLTNDGRGFLSLANQVTPAADGSITINFSVDEQSGGRFSLVDGVLLVDPDGNQVVYDNDSPGTATYTETGDWTRSGNTVGNPIGGSSRFVPSNSYRGVDIATFTIPNLGVSVDCDTDGDGLTNDCDGDSDGDGCPDIIESGLVGDGSSLVGYTPGDTTFAAASNPVGANGLLDGIETAAESGMVPALAADVPGTPDFLNATFQSPDCQSCTIDVVATDSIGCSETDLPAFTLNETGGTYTVITDIGTNIDQTTGVVTLGVNPGTVDNIDTIIYTLPDACADTVLVTTLAIPEANITPIADFCADAGAMMLEATPAGGTFTLDGMVITELDPAVEGPGDKVITYEVPDMTTGCIGRDTLEVTILALPEPTITPVGPLCANEAPVQLMADSMGGTFTTLSGMAFATPGLFDPAAMGTQTVIYTFNGVSCTGADTLEIVVNPAPTVTLGDIDTLCADGMAITLTGGNPATPAGTYQIDGVDAAGGQFDPALQGAGTYEISYIYQDAATTCSDTATTMLVVNPVPVPVITDPGEFCLGDPAEQLVATPAGGTFSGTGVDATGLFDPTVAMAATTTITYSVTVGGCTGTTSIDIIVNPLPVVEFPAQDPLCADAAEVTLGATPTGGEYSGTGIVGTGPTFDPSMASVGDNIIKYVFTDGNGCADSAEIDIIVNPLPVVMIDPIDTLCVDGNPEELTANLRGGTYSGPGVVMDTIFDPSLANVGVNEIIYVYVDPVTLCTGRDTIEIVVDELPTVTIDALPTIICEEDAAITLVGNPAGGTFNGTGVSGNTFNPGVAKAGPAMITYEFTGTDGCMNSVTVSFTVSANPEVTLVSTACDIPNNTYSVELMFPANTAISSDFGTVAGNMVTDIPDGQNVTIEGTLSGCTTELMITAPDCNCPSITPPTSDGNGEICLGAASPELSATLPTSMPGQNLTVNWYDAATGGTLLLANSLTFTPPMQNMAGTVRYYVETEDLATACKSSARTEIDLIVDALPVVTISAIPDECPEDLPVTLSAMPAGSPNPGVFSGMGVSNGEFDPSIGPGTYTITYTVSDANGCEAVGTTDVLVNAPTPVTVAEVDTVCINDEPVELVADLTPGTFRGPGVSGTTFDPSLVAAGNNYDIIYDYTDPMTTCQSSDTITITVNSLPVITIDPVGPICFDAMAVTLSATPTGPGFTGTFSGDGVANGEFTPMDAGLGVHFIVYEVMDAATGCTNIDSIRVTVNGLPGVSIGRVPDQCLNGGMVALTGTPAAVSPATGVFSGDGVTGDMFDPATVGANEVIYTYTDTNGCSASDTTTITVLAIPMSTLVDTVCSADNLSYSAELNVPAGATLTATAGTVMGNMVVGIPNSVDITVTTTLNGCSSDLSVAAPTCTQPIPPSVELFFVPPGGSLRACADTTQFPGDYVSVEVCGSPQLGMITNIDQATGCVDYLAPLVIQGARDSICLITRDNFMNSDTTIILITFPIPPDTIRFVVPADSTQIACADTTMLPGNLNSLEICAGGDPALGAVLSLDPVTGCAEYMAPSTPGVRDTFCLVVGDDQDFTDTTLVIITVPLPPDTIRMELPADSTDNFCVQTSMIPGNIASVAVCAGGDPSLGSLGVIDQTTGCVDYTAPPTPGVRDTFCLVVFDDEGFTDTTYVEILVPLPPDTIRMELPADSTDNFCVDLTMIPGNITSVAVCAGGDPSLGSLGPIDQVTGCVDYTAPSTPGVRDVFCLVVCDDEGFKDTTYIEILVPLPPDTLRMELPADSTENFCVDVGMIPGDIVSVAVCAGGDPSLGSLGPIDQLTGCVDYTAPPTPGVRDTFCLVVCDDQGFKDTTYIEIFTSLPPDTIRMVLPADSTDNFCADTTMLPGTFTSVAVCDGGDPSLGTLGTLDQLTGCVDYTAPPTPGVRDTFCLVVCDDEGFKDTTYIEILVPLPPDTLRMEVPADSTENFCVDTTMIPGNIVSVMVCEGGDPSLGSLGPIDQVTGCVDYTAPPTPGVRDTFCLVVCDDQGFKDTTYIEIFTSLPPDTIRMVVPADSTDNFCADTTMLPGTFTSVAVCDGGDPSLGTLGTLDQLTGCVDYTAPPTPGVRDTFCLVVCDDQGFKDTTYIEILVPLPPDTLRMEVPADSTENFCVDTTMIPGNIVSVMVCEGGDPSLGSLGLIDQVTGCVDYTAPPTPGVRDTFCLVVCDDQGFKDTTYIEIFTSLPPDTIRMVVPADSTQNFCADTTMLPGTFTSVAVCEGGDPSLGTLGTLDQLTGCVDYTAPPTPGVRDTFCLVVCDDEGFKDTTYIEILVPLPPDTIRMMVPADSTDNFCADTTMLPGTFTSVAVCEGGDPSLGTLGALDQLTGCVDYTAPPTPGVRDTFCLVVCDDEGFKDTTYIEILVPLPPDTIRMMVPADSTDNFCVDTTMIPGNITSVMVCEGGDPSLGSLGPIDQETGCVDYTAPPTPGVRDTFCLVVCDDQGFKDTTYIEILVPLPPDTIRMMVPADSTDNFCADTTMLPGTFTSVAVCEGGDPSLGTLGTLDQLTGCVDYTAPPTPGVRDTFCLVVCDDEGFKDTTYIEILVPLPPDTIRMMVPADSTDNFCADTTMLPGTFTSVAVCDGGDPSLGSLGTLDQLTGCVDYTAPPTPGVRDTFCLVVCDDEGFKDTTYIEILVPLPPDTIRMVVPADSTNNFCADTTMLPGTFTSVAVCEGGDPSLGTLGALDQLTGCVDYTAPPTPGVRDTFCLVVCDDEGFKDTTYIEILVPLPPDTIRMMVPADSTDNFCVDTSMIPGNITSVMVCEGGDPSLGSLGPIDQETGCVDYTAPPTPGVRDTFCLVVCDDQGFKDTTYIEILVPLPPDTIRMVVPADSTDNFCADTTMLPGTFTSVAVCEGGDPSLGTLGTLDQLTGCVDYTAPPTPGVRDTFCLVVCDDEGFKDTTYIEIFVPLVPDTIRFEIPADSLEIVCVDLDPAITMPGEAIICGDANELTTSAITPGMNCLDVSAGMVPGRDTICVVICDLLDPALCDTTIFIPKVLPAVPTSGGDREICIGDDTEVSATVPAMTTVNWYSAPTGGELLLENSLTYAPMVMSAGTFTYYAEGVGTADAECVSVMRTPIVLTVVANPVIVAIDTVGCSGEELPVFAEQNALAGTFTAISTIGTSVDASGVVTLGDNAGAMPVVDTIVFTSEVGCVDLQPIVVNPVPVITDVVTTVPLLCDNMTGSITITAEGGTGTLEYSIDGGQTFQNENIFLGLVDGVYNVLVRNAGIGEVADACPVTFDGNPVLLQSPPAPMFVSLEVDSITSCDPAATGTITITASIDETQAVDLAEEIPLQFSIDGGMSFVDGVETAPMSGIFVGTFTDLPADTYTIAYQKQDGTCMIDVEPPVVLAAPDSAMIVNTAVAAPSACNVADGAITVVATGGDAPLMFVLNGGVPQLSGSFTGLTNGDYVVEISNANGECLVTAVDTFLFTPCNVDTLRFVVPADSMVLTCATGDELLGTITSVDTCAGGSPGLGTVTEFDGTTGCVTYTAPPTPGVRDTFCLVVCDDQGLKDTTYIEILVPLPPDTIRMEVPADSTDNFCVDTSMIPGNITSVAVCEGGDPSLGSLGPIDQETGCVDYTAPPTPGVRDTFCLVVCDDQGFKDTTYVEILVPLFNNTTAQNDVNQTPINVPVSGNLLTNDSDSQGDGQSVQTVLFDTDGDNMVDDTLVFDVETSVFGFDEDDNLVDAGTITLNTDGTYTYTPSLDYTGEVPGLYTAVDDNVDPATDDATISITVFGGDDPDVVQPPVAIDDIQTTLVNTPVSANVIDPNDSDPEMQVLTVTSISGDTDGDGVNNEPILVGVPTTVFGTSDPSGVTVIAGDIVINDDGTYTYTPADGFVGNVNVDYVITDEDDLTDDANLSINIVSDVDNVTFANDDANSGLSSEEQVGNILDNDTDPQGDGQTVTEAFDSEGNPLTIGAPFTLPSGGTLTIEDDGEYIYVPLFGFIGTEVVPYTITDDNADVPATDMATLYLTTFEEIVVPLVNNTTAQNDVNQTPINVPVSGNLLTNDSDSQGDGQSVQTVLFDTDGDNMVDDTLVFDVETSVFGFDEDDNLVDAGTITLSTDGAYTYTPSLDYTGEVPGLYTAVDDNVDPATDDATISITVFGGDDPDVVQPPVAIDDIQTTLVNTPVSANVIDPNDSDPEMQVLTVTSISGDTDGDGVNNEPIPVGVPTTVFGTSDPSGVTVVAGDIVINDDGTYTYTPADGFVGNVNVDYVITDEDDLTDDANLSINIVSDVDNVTFANDDANSGLSSEEQVGNILDNDTDPQGDGQTVTEAFDSEGNPLTIGAPFTLPSGGTLTIEEDGEYVYVPLFGFIGTEVVPYTITDDNADVPATDMATLYLTTFEDEVDGVVAINDINQAPINTPVTGDLATNDFDLDGDDIFIDTVLVALDPDGIIDDVVPVGSTNTIYGVDLDGNVVIAGELTVNGPTPPTGIIARRGVSVLGTNFPYTFLPTTGYIGRVQIEYSIVDDNPAESRDRANLTIVILNGEVLCEPGPPVAINDIFLAESGTQLTENIILLDDYDADVPSLTVTQLVVDADGEGELNDTIGVSTPTEIFGVTTAGALVPAGTFAVALNGILTFTPDDDFIGDVEAEYTIVNENGFTDGAKTTITVVENQDNKSFANDDVAIGQVNVTLTGNVIENDADPEGDVQTVVAAFDDDDTTIEFATEATLPSGGTIVLEESGDYVYTPADGFIGTESVIYSVTDGFPSPVTFSATLHLTSIPVFADTIVVSTPQNVPVTTCIDLCGAAGPIEVINTCGEPMDGTLTDIDPVTGCVEYTPDEDFVGADEFCVVVTYDNGVLDTTRVFINVRRDSVNIACRGVVNVTLNDTCGFELIPTQVAVGLLPVRPNLSLDVVVLDSDPSNGNIIDGCGEYMYRLSAAAGTTLNGFTQCMGMVIASDKTPPVLVATPSDVTGLLCVDVAANNLNALPATVSRCFRVDGDGALDSASIDPALLAVLSPASFDNLDVDVALIPTFTDNCASALEVCVADVVSQADEDGCGPTVITRTFRATVAAGCDADDTELVASYTITFEQPNLGQLVSEPVMPTVEIEACATATAPTDFLPTSADYPQLEVPSGDTVRTFAANDPALMCANLVTTFETTNAVQTCESTVKFSRVYRVIDWCEPGTAREFTQFVKVGDSTGPVFTGPNVPGIEEDSTATLVFGTNVGDACAATVRLDGPGIAVQDACSGTDVELTVSIYPDGDLTRAPFGAYPVDLTDADAELSDALPVGDYAFVYTATDACGNATVTSVPFAVADRSGPVAICEDGLNVSLSAPAGSATITPEQIDLGSFDDCSGDDVNLRIGQSAGRDIMPDAFFDELALGCEDRGTVFVTLEVTDVAGNSNFCWLPVLVEQKVGDPCVCDRDDSAGPVIEATAPTECLPGCEADLALAITVTDDFSTTPVLSAELDANYDATVGFVADVLDGVVLPVTAGDAAGAFVVNATNVPLGDHAVRITATDDCGNATRTVVPFSVCGAAPTPICRETVVAVLAGGDMPMAEVPAADFLTSLPVDCLGDSVRNFGIVRLGAGPATEDQTSLKVFCADAGQLVAVEVYAFDDLGSRPAEFCTAFIEVQEGNDVDCGGTVGNLTGRIATQSNRAVSQVEVTLTGSDDMDMMSRTNDAGVFSFERVPLDGDYTVQPEHDVAIDLREVKISDVVAISRVILGVNTFDDAYDYAGADVDQSGSINVLDMVAIQRVILGLDDVYQTGESWRFVAGTYAVTNDNWMEAFPEVYNVNNLSGNLLGVDFVAVELGNVVGGQGRASLDLELEDARLESGQTHTLTFGSAALAGWQGTLEVGRDLEIVNVDYTGEGGLNTAYTPEGVVGVLLRGESAVSLTVRAITPVLLSEAIELTDGLVLQEGVTQMGEPVGLGLAFTSTSIAPASAQNALYQNVPNPVVETTLIEFDLAEAGEATLTVRDITGRLLTERTVEGLPGRNQLILNRSDLGAAGTLTYTLVSGTFTASKKMVVLR